MKNLLHVLIALAAPIAAHGQGAVQCTPPHPWAGGMAAPPRIPMAGDVDGDGYADLLALYPEGKCIVDVSLNAGDQKSVWGFQAKTEFGENAVGAAAGRFLGGKTVDVPAVFADGSVRMLAAFDPVTRKFAKEFDLGKIDAVPKGRVVVIPVAVKSLNLQAAVLLHPNGKLWWLQYGIDLSLLLRCGTLNAVKAVSATTADGRTELAAMDSRGQVTVYAITSGGIGKGTKLRQAKPGDNLVAGNFDGNGKTDLLIGTTVLWDGDPSRTTEWPEVAAVGTGEILAADMGNRGRDDLILFRRDKPAPAAYGPGTEPYTRYDEYLLCTYAAGDPDWDRDGLTNDEEKRLGTDPRVRDTDHDGLLDGWEVKGAPGFDLPKLGCDPRHKDVICEIHPQASVDRARLERETKMVFDTYSKLNIDNPDGKKGIHFVPILRDSLPKSEETKGWGQLAGEQFPLTHRGYDHWMAVYNGGGGQSSQMGDAGSCGIGAFWAVFIHEFGHQLGLDHCGFWPTWGPSFPSLMNYNYSYSFMGRWDAIHYSDGTLAKLVVREDDLSEVLPYPMKDVEFMSMGPYYFRMKPDGPNRTLIDWNWNGIFGELHVKADVNYAYATTIGEAKTLGKTWTAPFLQAVGNKELMIFKGVELASTAPGAKYVAAPPQPDKPPVEPKTDEEKRLQGLRKGNKDEVALVFQTCGKDHQWSEPIVVEPRGVTYDAQSVAVGKDVWVFYPTASGVKYRVLSRAVSGWSVGPAQSVPESAGMQGSPWVYRGRLYLVLFAGPDKDLLYRVKTPSGWSEPKTLGFRSNVAVGLATDTLKNHLLVGLAQDKNEKSKGRWQVRRLAANPDGSLYELGAVWIEGDNGASAGSFRPVVLFDPGKENGPNGRIYFFATGMVAADGSSNWACFYVAHDIADKTHRGGWLVKLIVNEWNASRSTVAATFFGGDIAAAFRWVDPGNPVNDNVVYVGFGGKGIDAVPMGDLNELEFLGTIGLYRPILSFATKDAIKK